MTDESDGDKAGNHPAPTGKGGPFRALRNRDYRLLWSGQCGHSAALWVETIARSWLIWELTGSATLLATVNLLRALPMLFFGLLAGVVADRVDRRKILIVCQTVTLTNYIIIATLIATGVVEVWHVLLSAFIMGCSMSFNQPARTALVPSLVKDDELQSAVALNSAALNMSRIIGPTIAGVLIAPIGISGVYFISAGVYVATLATTVMMRVPPVIKRIGKTSLQTDMGETFRYVYKTKIVFALLLLALVPMVFAQPYMTILPVFADEILHVAESGYGYLMSGIGAGALITVLLIATLKNVRRKGLLILFCIFSFGALLVGFSQSTWFYLSLFSIALVGATSTAARVLTDTSLLEISPPALRGRVMSIHTLDRGLVPLGTMAIGLLTDAIGAPTSLLIMGSLCAVFAIIVAIVFPVVRRTP